MYRLGFDIGGTNIAYGLLDESFHLLSKGSVPFPRTENGLPMGAEAVALQLKECAKRIYDKHSFKPECVELAGICLPGSIDASMRKVINAHNIGFHDVPFAEIAEDALGMKVAMRNDADAATIAEHGLGALKGASCAVLVTLGTGVGGGIIMAGKLFHGGRGSGVELGHMRIKGGGQCTCGNFGCMETVCSASWLTSRAESLYRAGNIALINAVGRGSAADARTLIECARTGDRDCISVWNEYIDSLSDALASIINLLDPELIALGGGVSGAGDFLIEPLSRLSIKKCFFDDAARIVRAKLGNDAGLIGAAMDD